MAAMDWLEKRMQRRQREMAIRTARVTHARKRGWSRDMARVMLAASLLVLGVLMVEMGRKAVTVMTHAQTVSSMIHG